MGASESSISGSQKRPDDEITVVSERLEGTDPVLEKLRSLKIATPMLKSLPSETSLTDILVRRPSPSAPGAVNPRIILELFSVYRDWHEDKAWKISMKQEEIENKIELVDALSVKLLQRLNFSAAAMKTTSQHLSGVHALQVEIGELKGSLTEVISNCDALCNRIASEAPESLRSLMTPFATNLTTIHSRSSVQKSSGESSPSSEPKEDRLE